MRKKIVGCLLGLLLLVHCGFIQKPRLTKWYVEEMIPDSAPVNLVIWPIHLVALASLAVVDQGIHTFVIIPSALGDAADYFKYELSNDNIMLKHTIAVPKLLSTPFVFLGSYVARWFVPLEPNDRLFDSERPRDTVPPIEKEPRPETKDGPAPENAKPLPKSNDASTKPSAHAHPVPGHHELAPLV